jgi:hypothetical protein
VIIVRFADDLMVGFIKSDAARSGRNRSREMQKYSLELPSRENATGIQTVRGWKLEETRRRETGHVQLPRIYPHLREEEEEEEEEEVQ